MLTQKQSNAESGLTATNVESLKRYTYRQLYAQAKQAFRRIQKRQPDGGSKQDYQYKGWDILINRGNISQILNYDVKMPETTLKRSSIIAL
jgi:hypothetical protein